MRLAICLLTLAALVASEISDEPWVEEEDLEEHYNDYEENERSRRAVYNPGPLEERHRVKRYEDKSRKKRSDYVRNPRQVHQYEVHEAFEDGSAPLPPYEEMLAASAEHYHKVYAAPGPRPRYLNPEVSAGPLTFGVHPDPIQVVSAPIASNPLHYVTNQPNQNNQVHHETVDTATPLKVAADLSQAAGHHQHVHHPHSHGHAQGGGNKHHGQHHAEHGGKTTKGFKTDHHVDKGGKGHKTDELHRKEYEDAAGHKKKHHDHADHKGSHEEQAHGHKGAKFDEKKGHKKGHKTKGFHNKYHKDEFHKEHKFYDDYHKSGEHHRYGKFNAKHASDESGKKKAHHVNAGHDFVEKGKKGYSNKGHIDADHKGYNGKRGHEEHHQNHSQHGKKGAKEGGSHWGYAKKN